MAFNAGEITASLTLDRSPFQRGLDEARAEAARFEENRVKAQLGVDGVPKTLAELAAVEHELDKIDGRNVSPDVSAFSRIATGAQGASSRVSMLHLAIAGLGPALAPVSAVAVGGIGLLAPMFAAAGAGALGFGLVALPTLKEVAAAATKTGAAQKRALAELGPGAAGAVKALKDFDKTWDTFRRSFQPQVFELMNVGLNGAKQLLPSLRPLIANAGAAFIDLAKQATHALQGPFWQQFIHFLAGQAGPAIRTFGGVLGNLAHGFAGVMMAFKPIIAPFEAGLLRMSRAFATWGQNLGSSAGFQHFLTYLRTNAPLVGKTLADLGRAALDIGKAFAQSGPSMLHTVDVLARLATTLAGSKVGAFVLSITPLALLFLRIVGPLITLVSWVTRLAPVFETLAAVSVALDVGMLPLIATVGAVVLAIGALVAVAVLVVTHWSDVKRALGDAWNFLKKVAGDAFGAVKRAAQDGLLGPIALVISRWGDVKRIVGDAWKFLQRLAGDAWGAIKHAVTTAVGDAVAFVGSAWSKARKTASDAWTGMKTTISKVAGDIVTFVKGLPGKIVHALGDLGKLLLGAGEDLVRGLINGIKNMAGKAVQAVKDVVGFLPGLARSLLGSHSPSMVFHAIGEDTMKGLENGLKAGGPAALAVIQTAITRVKQDFADFVAAGGKATAQLRAVMQRDLSQLTGLQNFEKAVDRVTTKLQTLAKQALTTFIDQRLQTALAGIASGPESQELATLQAQQQAAQRAQQNQQNQQALTAARTSGDLAAIRQAQDAIDQAQREWRIQDLQAAIQAKTDEENKKAELARHGQDAEANTFEAGLQRQLAAFEKALARRKISYAAFLKDIDALFSQVGISPAIGAGDAATLSAGAPRPARRLSTAPRGNPYAWEGGWGRPSVSTTVNVRMPTPVAAGYQPDPLHLSALLGQALRTAR